MTKQDFNRRSFLTKGAAAGAGAVALAGAATEAGAQGINWDQTADVVIVGAGVSGLPAAITARELGASVIIVEENYDIGGRGMLSGGRVQLGGGHALQQKFNIKDNADQVFLDWVRADDAQPPATVTRSHQPRMFRPTTLPTTASSLSKPIVRSDPAALSPGGCSPRSWRRTATQWLGPRRAERRAQICQAQDDADHPRSPRAGACWHRSEGRRQDHQHRATKGVIVRPAATGNVNFAHVRSEAHGEYQRPASLIAQ